MDTVARRLSTGAPEPPPVWQLLCEFANGYCICGSTGREQPCDTVQVAADRIVNRVLLDRSRTERAVA